MDKTLVYQTMCRRVDPLFVRSTVSQVSVSVWPMCWFDVKVEVTHSLKS